MLESICGGLRIRDFPLFRKFESREFSTFFFSSSSTRLETSLRRRRATLASRPEHRQRVARTRGRDETESESERERFDVRQSSGRIYARSDARARARRRNSPRNNKSRQLARRALWRSPRDAKSLSTARSCTCCDESSSDAIHAAGERGIGRRTRIDWIRHRRSLHRHDDSLQVYSPRFRCVNALLLVTSISHQLDISQGFARTVLQLTPPALLHSQRLSRRPARVRILRLRLLERFPSPNLRVPTSINDARTISNAQSIRRRRRTARVGKKRSELGKKGSPRNERLAVSSPGSIRAES